MLSLFRHPQFTRRIAILIAFAFVFLASVGELVHARQHQSVKTQTDIKLSQATKTAMIGNVAVASDTSQSCPFCEWEKMPTVAFSFALCCVLTLFFVPRFGRFVPSPTFFVRLAAALRESRGPPALA